MKHPVVIVATDQKKKRRKKNHSKIKQQHEHIFNSLVLNADVLDYCTHGFIKINHLPAGKTEVEGGTLAAFGVKKFSEYSYSSASNNKSSHKKIFVNLADDSKSQWSVSVLPLSFALMYKNIISAYLPCTPTSEKDSVGDAPQWSFGILPKFLKNSSSKKKKKYNWARYRAKLKAILYARKQEQLHSSSHSTDRRCGVTLQDLEEQEAVDCSFNREGSTNNDVSKSNCGITSSLFQATEQSSENVISDNLSYLSQAESDKSPVSQAESDKSPVSQDESDMSLVIQVSSDNSLVTQNESDKPLVFPDESDESLVIQVESDNSQVIQNESDRSLVILELQRMDQKYHLSSEGKNSYNAEVIATKSRILSDELFQEECFERESDHNILHPHIAALEPETNFYRNTLNDISSISSGSNDITSIPSGSKNSAVIEHKNEKSQSAHHKNIWFQSIVPQLTFSNQSQVIVECSNRGLAEVELDPLATSTQKTNAASVKRKYQDENEHAKSYKSRNFDNTKEKVGLRDEVLNYNTKRSTSAGSGLQSVSSLPSQSSICGTLSQIREKFCSTEVRKSSWRRKTHVHNTEENEDLDNSYELAF